MDIENFIAEFKKTFVYEILSQTLSDEQLFERVVDGDAVLWFKEQTRQMWLMWEKAKAQAVPDGYCIVPKEPTPKMIDATWDYDGEIQEMSHNTRNEFIYKTMIDEVSQ